MMKKLYLFCLIVPVVFASCSDWLTVQPQAQVSEDNMFKTEAGFKSALNGLYMLMRIPYRPDGDMVGYKLVEGLACTWSYTTTASTEYALATHDYTHSSVISLENTVFRNLYKIIINANLLIDALRKEQILTPDVHAIILGEALAIRAYVHFDLLRLWGPMPSQPDETRLYLPYVTTLDYNPYTYLPYRQYLELLQRDLDEAERCLEQYEPLLMETVEASNSSGATWSFRRSHLNYYGVLGLQARLHLWLDDKPEALRYALAVKDAKNEDGSPKFRLGNASDFATWTDGTFYSEHLFGVHVEDFNPQQASYAHTTPPVFNMNIPAGLFESDLSDIRFKYQWVSCRTPMGPWAYTSRKYHGFSSATTPQHVPLIRLGEMYLIIMECGTLGQANEANEEFVTARGCQSVPFTAENRTPERIMREYLKELAVEGQNFYAYKRLALPKMLWGPEDGISLGPDQYVLPIPEAEIIY